MCTGVLLQNGASAEAKDKDGATPLDLAAMQLNCGIIQLSANNMFRSRINCTFEHAIQGYGNKLLGISVLPDHDMLAKLHLADSHSAADEVGGVWMFPHKSNRFPIHDLHPPWQPVL